MAGSGSMCDRKLKAVILKLRKFKSHLICHSRSMLLRKSCYFSLSLCIPPSLMRLAWFPFSFSAMSFWIESGTRPSWFRDPVHGISNLPNSLWCCLRVCVNSDSQHPGLNMQVFLPQVWAAIVRYHVWAASWPSHTQVIMSSLMLYSPMCVARTSWFFCAAVNWAVLKLFLVNYGKTCLSFWAHGGNCRKAMEGYISPCLV